MIVPLDLGDTDSYLRWRDKKLALAIVETNELVVEIKDPTRVTESERNALFNRCHHCNMAIYASDVTMDERMLRDFGAQFGLLRLDANWLADKHGISRIAVSNPYNPPQRQIRGMVLHCAQNAGNGGENRVMDHEIAYMMLRDTNPDFIRALSVPDVMTIPARVDEFDGVREAQTGPVFSQDAAGNLHMRYTARTRSIEWKQDANTLAAVAQLEQILDSDSAHIHQLKMEAGMGLLCNNVLHDRSAFTDDPNNPRLLYRARYLDRVSALSTLP
ncbi:MAG: hypothetical protein FD121_1348 [Gallionellaceae bacterium]|nr:MAG: hypothetical protein FD121_1348 [Gallionellaceae bacterium]